ncbi:MAG: hypothetical protein D6772_10860, partial [Bacteroidetes bacterium]
ALHIYPHPLLQEASVKEQALSTGLYERVPTICEVAPGGDLPFDPFAASFYLLSRYEEYLPYPPDAHGRFPAAISWASRARCLKYPIVWEWSLLLWRALQLKYPGLARQKRSYRYVPTFDVDSPWAFRHRGLRGLARAFLDLCTGKWELSRQRLATWSGLQADPFYTFPYLRKLHERRSIRPRIFWLVAAQRTRYDISPSPNLRAYHALIRSTTSWADSGLHPSYASNDTPSLLARERDILGDILGSDITHSRQHYLRLCLPDTCRQLLAAGIRHDYTMGFADAIGYRAGTSEPFYWFDLESNQVTQLRIHPFAAMDVTLRKYLNMSPQVASEALHELQAYAQQHGLSFSTLWHNSSFSATHGWAGWQTVYEGLLG